jgi:putative thioredoxin
MAKLDTDKHPQVAQQLGVKSLPTVMLVNEGKLVDQFVGFPGEGKVKEFVVKAAGLSRGNAGQGQDPNDILAMQGMLGNVLELLKVAATPQAPGEPTHEISKDEMQEMIGALRTLASHKLEPLPQGTTKTPKRRTDEDALEMVRGVAHAGLIRCALLDGNQDAAKEIAQVTKNTFSKPVLEHPEVKAALSLASLAAGASSTDEVRNTLEAKLKENPKDSESRLALAKALFADGAHGQAIEQALELLKRDRTFQDGAARNLLIDIFNALGSNDMVKEGRRRMSSILMN